MTGLLNQFIYMSLVCLFDRDLREKERKFIKSLKRDRPQYTGRLRLTRSLTRLKRAPTTGAQHPLRDVYDIDNIDSESSPGYEVLVLYIKFIKWLILIGRSFNIIIKTNGRSVFCGTLVG